MSVVLRHERRLGVKRVLHVHHDEDSAYDNTLNATTQDRVGYDGKCFVDNHVGQEKGDK